MALYPKEIRSLLTDCEAYLCHKLDLEMLKKRIWNTSQTVVAYEERELRRLLMSVEGELDSIQYTTDDDKIFERSRTLVEKLRDVLNANLTICTDDR